MKNSVLVIIVTYNAMKWADRCFSSLKNSSIPNDVFVVDNGSTDGTQCFIREKYPDIIFHQSESNLGFGRANNLGFEYALKNGYEYVYLLNQDAWIMEDTLEKLITFQISHPDYGVLSPLQMQANLRKLDSAFQTYVCDTEPTGALLSDFNSESLKDHYDVAFVMAAHWFISTKNLKKIGGFSPTFPHYGEDDNFINRTIYHNFKIGILSLCKAVHDREDRILSNDKIIYLYYISYLKQLSNPFLTTKNMMVRFLYNSFKNAFVYKSVKPLHYFYKISCSYKEILKNRRESLEKESPFLNI